MKTSERVLFLFFKFSEIRMTELNFKLFNKNLTYFFNLDKQDDCNQCTVILEELENIDDDCDRHGITFVKTQVSQPILL